MEHAQQLAQTDRYGNSIEGQAWLHDTHNCHIHSSERVIGTVGVENLIIVDTPDALLVADRNATQQVKSLYSRLKTEGNDVHHAHRTVYRPWGTYTVLEESTEFKIKRIIVKPGACLSLQMHHHRNEHWIVVRGTAKVTRGEEVFLLKMNESTFIHAGQKHRLENTTETDLVLIEVQTGNYLGEDDIIRFEDIYGRDQLPKQNLLDTGE